MTKALHISTPVCPAPRDRERAQRHAEGLALAAIEGNPLTPEDIALLEEHDRLGLTGEQSIEAIKALFVTPAPMPAE